MKQDKKISILLATYNGEAYVHQQVNSILRQSYQNFVIIASDDGSSDATKMILHDYQTKYPGKVILLEDHVPFYSARDNFFYLMECCPDGYAMFCDQDDVWETEKIEKTLNVMCELEEKGSQSDPHLVFTDLEVVDANLRTIARSFMRFSKIDGKRTILRNLLIQNVVTGCTVMMNGALRTSALRCVDRTAVLMHDWWIALVAAVFGQIAFIDETTVKYRQHGSNTIGAKKYLNNPKLLLTRIFQSNIKQSIKGTTFQARAFLKTYGSIMQPQDRKLLEGFANLYDRRKWSRIDFMMRNRLLKYGALRKFAQIIWG